jgi:hypothetical protein
MAEERSMAEKWEDLNVELRKVGTFKDKSEAFSCFPEFLI